MAPSALCPSQTYSLKRITHPANVTDGSDPKKLKGDEEEKAEEYDEHASSDDDDYLSAEHRAAVKKFKKQFAESEGFDFDPYEGPNTYGGSVNAAVLDVENDRIDTWTYECKKAVDFAIRKENEKRNQKGEQSLEFVKLSKANFLPPAWFYATFEARTVPDGAPQLYQTRVFYSPVAEEHDESFDYAEVAVFRTKPGV